VRDSSRLMIALTVCALVTGWATVARALETSSLPQHPVPVVLDGGMLNGPCALASAQDGDTCAFWFASGDGSSQFGYANLDLWNVASDAACSDADAIDRADWIANGYPDLRAVNATAEASSPTYACYDMGHTISDWMDLSNEVGKVKIFPVNDCAGQVDAGGAPAPCPAIPDKFDVTGFVPLLIRAVYRGDDPLAIGTFGSNGTCATKKANTKNWTTDQSLDLDAITWATSGWGGCSSWPTDTAAINPSDVTITAGNGDPYVQCPPPGTAGCAYTYDPTTHVVTWVGPDVTGTSVTFNWKFSDTPGACGNQTSNPNAICLVLEVVDPLPDAAIGVAKGGPFRGNDVYGTDGAGQTRRRTIEDGTTDNFFIPLQDDVLPDETLVVSGGGSGRNLGIRYFLAGTEVTSSVTGGGLVLTTVPAGAALTLRMSVTVRSGARAGRERTIKVRAVSDFDAGAIDVVGAGVTTA
jgi:hypothetical protein